MPIRSHAEYLKRYLQERGDSGITVLPETEPPSTTTIDIIMRRPWAESRDNQRRRNPDSLDDTPCVGPTR